MTREEMDNRFNNNGLGNLQIVDLSQEELGKIKALEDEINKNIHGDRVALMALTVKKTIQ
ncbi:hypothetical protein HNQ80_002313 [Anaerosolibacter carboniphilus]|uniref:Uncharacterized protein n=1 Tax=Anaerosolibacter carboniphilus TaxID=1417629 RepID=A0A841KR40_9FIRM|nr:hypothetical protein [Anaerosolibacter carboniphilus]MBB6216214.1 hypothetical protein [Anaerosolibacter carboniphilus]